MAPLLLVALLSLNVAFVAGETICLGKPADVLNFKIWPEACVNATEGTVCTAVCNDRLVMSIVRVHASHPEPGRISERRGVLIEAPCTCR